MGLFRRDKENGEAAAVRVTDAAPRVDLMRFERLVQSSIRLRELGITLGFRANMARSSFSELEYPREDHANLMRAIAA